MTQNDIYQHYDYVRNITSSSNEDSCVLGNGTVVSNDFLNGQEKLMNPNTDSTNELLNQGVTPDSLANLR